MNEDLRNNIVAKRSALPKDAPNVEADASVLQPLTAFFDSKFRWQPGEYQLILRIKTEPASAGVTKRFRFTLFESDTQGLKDIQKEYKYGGGVIIDLPVTPWVRAGELIELIEV